MPDITFDTAQLGYMRAFEDLTHAKVMDCLEAEDKLVYVVHPEDLKKAVGPHGEIVERLKQLFHREIQVVVWDEDTAKFVQNLFFPFSPQKVDFSPKPKGRHATVTVDPKFKARAIGKQGKNLKIARAVLLRHSDIVSVNVA
ncbi:MAG: NusA-like transcription termination signal-binding factor [Euryarchaeota archaeon]|nr:NusA-like transcription termination signal-binding factor [Euryarchaeota archaeon]MDE1837902.1 NusA-like transcription termination signal-binding factor [Euryarchaeota archaeon]MDE1881280.1 NusA-like transcription termination signal-binding factor [Euryarchaeota archaeon]MDE2046260.1 NusA-like transcription termination signal-binding factor [Thermoplasmata archaeon]